MAVGDQDQLGATSGVGGGGVRGMSAPSKSWFVENPGKIRENPDKIYENVFKIPEILGKLSENMDENGAQHCLSLKHWPPTWGKSH